MDRLAAVIPDGEKIVWMHCASLGEFEQGRTVIESIKAQFPSYRMLLTFFSPSGYEIAKNYARADWIFYLPLDGPRNARRFLEIVQPQLVIFVKYELWYYYLKKIKYRNIPLILISALFRKDMSFFKWHGSLQRKMLARFNHIFVQNDSSKKLIDKLGLNDISSISGDTRFDRVTEIANQWQPIPIIEQFIGGHKTIVAGSTWPEDEIVLQKALSGIDTSSWRVIIAPHEIAEKRLIEIKSLFPDSLRYSELASATTPHRYLVIDNMGMLARLYKYGDVTYVGGGLRPMGVHNVLEAAVFNKVVIFGPYYHKYQEAVGLVLAGGGLPFNDHKKNGALLKELIEAIMTDAQEYTFRCRAAGDFVRSNQGATGKIMDFIQEKRLLTN